MHASRGTPFLVEFILTNQSKLTSKSPVTNFISRSFLISWHTSGWNLIWCTLHGKNKKGLVRTLLLDLDKHTYLMLQAKYKDKLKTSTEYYTLKRVIT